MTCSAGSIAYTFVAILFFTSPLAALVAVCVGLATLARLVLWFHPGALRIPILWILYAGYAWVVTGFFLSALASLGIIAPTVAIHAFTAGAIGTMIVGMVSRVTLGHTGRPLVASTPTVIAFALVLAGSMTRVFGPLLIPQAYTHVILCSGVMWVFALLTLLGSYAPKLVRPRVE